MFESLTNEQNIAVTIVAIAYLALIIYLVGKALRTPPENDSPYDDLNDF